MRSLHQSANESQSPARGVVSDDEGPIYMASVFTWEKKTGFVEGANIGINWGNTYPEFLRVKSDRTNVIKTFDYHGSVVSVTRRIEFVHYRNKDDDLSLILLRVVANMVPPKRSEEYAKYF